MATINMLAPAQVVLAMVISIVFSAIEKKIIPALKKNSPEIKYCQ